MIYLNYNIVVYNKKLINLDVYQAYSQVITNELKMIIHSLDNAWWLTIYIKNIDLFN